MENPFQYGKVVAEPYFTDRETELASLIKDVEGRHNVVLHSPRRYGKTSLLCKLAACMQERDYNVIYLDFFRVTSRESFMELYSREIFNQSGKRWKSVLKQIGALVQGMRPVVSFDAQGKPKYSVTFEAGKVLSESLESVLDLTEKLDPPKCWLVIFDEFQEIAKLNGESFENALRAAIQHHKRSSYVFSGSRHHLLLDIFNRPGRAFYRFGKVMQLAKIDPAIMEKFVVDRFKQSGKDIPPELAAQLIERVENIPNYVQYLAAELWQLAWQKNCDPDAALLERALESMLDNLADFFLRIWDGLSLQQKRIVLALSRENTNPFSQDYHKRYRLGPISSSQRAIQKLLADQLLAKRGSAYEFSDPLFLLFIRKRFLA